MRSRVERRTRKACSEGVELVLRELTAALTRHGVTAVEAEGQPFDPDPARGNERK
jgi:molecular chaperone GrpE (heat shock protein)